MDLIKQALAAREYPVQIGEVTFTLRRMTTLDWLRRSSANLDAAIETAVGWKGVTEAAFLPSGGSDAVPFSGAAMVLYVGDRPELWKPLEEAFVKAHETHAERLGALRKNSPRTSDGSES